MQDEKKIVHGVNVKKVFKEKIFSVFFMKNRRKIIEIGRGLECEREFFEIN